MTRTEIRLSGTRVLIAREAELQNIAAEQAAATGDSDEAVWAEIDQLRDELDRRDGALEEWWASGHPIHQPT
jgi:hypothetical protein